MGRDQRKEKYLKKLQVINKLVEEVKWSKEDILQEYGLMRNVYCIYVAVKTRF